MCTLFDVPRILPVEFTAFLVAKQGAKADLATALRLWGCAAQAGIFVGGLLLSPSGKAATPLEEFAPLKSLTLPAAEDMVGEAATGLGRELAEVVSAAASSSPRPKIDQAAGSVALFLPGFDKTEVRALHLFHALRHRKSAYSLSVRDTCLDLCFFSSFVERL